MLNKKLDSCREEILKFTQRQAPTADEEPESKLICELEPNSSISDEIQNIKFKYS